MAAGHRERPQAAALDVWQHRGAPVKVQSTRPAITSATDGAVPLYGMCTINTVALSFRYPKVMCAALPLPPEAQVSLAGLARAASSSSRKLWYGDVAPTTSTLRTRTT